MFELAAWISISAGILPADCGVLTNDILDYYYINSVYSL
jgi:hypothetical protein